MTLSNYGVVVQEEARGDSGIPLHAGILPQERLMNSPC